MPKKGCFKIKQLKLKLFFNELNIFLFAQLTALIVGIFYISQKSFITQLTQPAVLKAFEVWYFVLYFFFATAFVLLMIKYLKNNKYFFNILFILVLFGGIYNFFYIFFEGIISLLLTAMVMILKYFFPSILMHNLTTILAIAGICGYWGAEFSVLGMIVLLLVLSIYDYIAVYKTKHMIKMAEKMMSMHVLIALIIPEQYKNYLVKFSKLAKYRNDFMIIGGGDIALPALFLVSITAYYDIFHSLVTLFFLLIGLFMMHCIFNTQKQKKPMPALPPLAIFSIVGFIFSLLL